MIGKVGPRGGRVAGLLYYLFGPGRCQEHTDPHLVVGWRHPAELEPPLRPDGHRDFRHLTGLLQQPHDALGERGFDHPVWHCSVRAAPGDRMLSDDEWAQVACEIMHRTGLAPYGQEDEAVRWVAVRHAADHIHIVAMLARQDGTRLRLWNDYYRIGEACRAAENRFGLRRTAPRDRTAARRPTRAESEKARRHGLGEPPRITLRRAVSTAAAGAANEHEFFTRLTAAGVQVRKRFSSRNPGQVTGYAVALPPDTTRDGGPVWYSGGKLAPDLTLPKLRHRWSPATTPVPAEAFTPAERRAIYEHAANTARQASQQIRHCAATDPRAAADAAWATADTLRAGASALGNKDLHRAAESYDRAARLPYGRIPHPTPAGTSLRTAARLLSSVTITGSGTDAILAAQMKLILRLTMLVEAIASLRTAQQHAAQANAARAAAQRLRAAPHLYAPPAPARATTRTPTSQARGDFPIPLRDVLARALRADTGQAPANGPARRPAQPRQRGPTR